MKKHLHLAIALLFLLPLATQGYNDVNKIDVEGIFTAEFQQKITQALNSPEPTVFKTPIKGLGIYKGDAKLFGQLTVGDGKIIGSGLISIGGSLTKADDLQFTNSQIKANHATFIVKSRNPSKPVLEVSDVAITYDFLKKNAFIQSLNKLEKIILPNNQVSLGFEQMLWQFDSKDIELNSGASLLYVRSNNINHKGLDFLARKISYSFAGRTLDIEGVAGIHVSNATIVPEGGKVVMAEGAKIDTLRNAKVMLDNSGKEHSLSTGDILIISKEKFDGIGHYELETYTGEKVMLEFSNFRQSSRTINHGDGKKTITENIGESFIPIEKSIEVMPGILYNGKVLLSDYKKEFDLDGTISLNIEDGKQHWFPYNTIVHNDINITPRITASHSGKFLHTGIYICGSERELYSSFVEATDKDGIPFFLGEGKLDYNADRNAYEINKITNVASISRTQKFHYHKATNEIDFEGSVNFGENTNYFSQRSSAIGTVNANSNQLDMNAMIIMDFRAPKKLFQHMIYTLDDYRLNHGAKPTNKKFFASQLYHILNEDELNYIGKDRPENLRLADFLTGSVVLTNLEMKWSESDHSFHSVGQIGISNLFNMNVDANLNGFVYVPKRQNNHEIHVYFEVGESWYYMKRDGDTLSFFSSEDDFNKMLKGKSGKYELLSETEAEAMIGMYKRDFK